MPRRTMSPLPRPSLPIAFQAKALTPCSTNNVTHDANTMPVVPPDGRIVPPAILMVQRIIDSIALTGRRACP